MDAGAGEVTSPFRCDMSAIDPAQRQQHVAAAAAIFRAVQVVDELPDGYAFRLPTEPDILLKTAEFIVRERLCCPFFAFRLDVAPEGGPVWLRLTGPEGIKPFIQAEIGGALHRTVADAAHFVQESHRDG